MESNTGPMPGNSISDNNNKNSDHSSEIDLDGGPEGPVLEELSVSTNKCLPPEEPVEKKRKIHMNDQECLDHSKTETGAMPLTNPGVVKTSSKDPNRNLYPRATSRRHPGQTGFVSAKQMFTLGADSLLSQNPAPYGGVSTASATQGSPKGKGRGRSSKGPNLPPQKNKVNNYFTCVSQAPAAAAKLSDLLPCTPPKHPSSVSQGKNSPSPVKTSPSKMFSPMKQVPGTNIYVTDRTSPRLTSSQGSAGLKTSKDEVNIVKVLFASQGQVAGARPNAGQKSKAKIKRKQPRFNRDNRFLYSNDPIPMSSQPSLSSSSSSSHYGLLGADGGDDDVVCLDSDEDEEDLDYFSMLPVDVVENIFCHLPLMDLVLNVSLVCHDWHDVISNKMFAPWKKRYHRLRTEQSGMLSQMVQILLENEMQFAPDYLPGLIKYMVNFKPVTATNMHSCLQKHPKYTWAEDLLKERFPECIKHGTPNPWSVITVLAVMSEFVRDIERIIWCLLSPTSQCTAMEVSECLYCIGCFLHVFKATKFQDVWTGMHYRVMYGLYLFENSSSKAAGQMTNVFKNSGQQSLLKYSTSDNLQLTHEQFRICNHDIQLGETLKIVAFAGTGKTTTLLKYTQLRPSKRFLLVVFNRSVRDHAQARFPPNVTCKTGHALAFRHTAIKYKNKPGKLQGNLRVTQVVNVLPHRKGESLFVQAKFVIDALNNFMASAEQNITTAHVPTQRMAEDGTMTCVTHDVQMLLANDAEKVWSIMIDQNNTKVPMTHDGYLKLYQLRNPTISDYDIILIDEAQDLTPAIADILLRQTQPKILVGDPHQQIYAFRGAVDAMQRVQASHTFYLTQSFRFGPEIAFVAASCLEFLKGEKRKVLVGNGIPGSVRGETEGQVAVICRSNFAVFQEAVKKCCYSNDNVKVAFAGGTDAFGFEMIQDMYTLMIPEEQRKKERRHIRNPLIQRFQNQSFAELEKYAKKTSDNELLGKIKIVRTYNVQLPSIISKIMSKTIADIDMADIVFSTAHKAKGLEFSTVRLTDDYNVTPTFVQHQMGGAVQQTGSEECNLLYVAATRAKRRLIMTPTLVKLLRFCGEKFQYPVHSQQLKKEGVLSKCMHTGRDFEPLAVTLVQRQITTGPDLIKSEHGLFCPQTVREEIASLRHVLGSLVDEREVEQQQQQP